MEENGCLSVAEIKYLAVAAEKPRLKRAQRDDFAHLKSCPRCHGRYIWAVHNLAMKRLREYEQEYLSRHVQK